MTRIVALLADAANGIFAMLAAAWLTQTEVMWWHVCIALPLAMLPDIDAIPELIRRRRVSASAVSPHDHRTFLHYPAVALLLVALLVTIGDYWALLVAFALVLHLINDLYGTGWGLSLLWPVSKTRYKFFARRVNRLKHMLVEQGDWESLPVSERKLRVLVRWTERELPAYITRWGVDDWIPPCYFTINWLSGVEYALWITSILLLMLQLR